MKKSILKSFVLALLLIVSTFAFSQDKIKLLNQGSFVCVIVNIGPEFVSYTQEETKDEVFKIEVSKIEKIVFESGREVSYNQETTDFNASITEDKIYKKNQDVIICKVVEIGEEYVKYTQEDTRELVFQIDVMRVTKIVFSSGKEMSFIEKITDPELYYGQSKNAYKFGLFSPATGALSIGYERSIKPGASVDMSVGFIGVGFNEVNGNDAKGAYFDVGYKFIVTPSYHRAGTTYGHLLRGFYFKPKFALSMYGREFSKYNNGTGFSTRERHQVVAGAVTLDLGWQWVIGDMFLLNMYGGFGYGMDNMRSIRNSLNPSYYEYDLDPSYHYGFTVGGQIPLAFTAGLKIGITK